MHTTLSSLTSLRSKSVNPNLRAFSSRQERIASRDSMSSCNIFEIQQKSPSFNNIAQMIFARNLRVRLIPKLVVLWTSGWWIDNYPSSNPGGRKALSTSPAQANAQFKFRKTLYQFCSVLEKSHIGAKSDFEIWGFYGMARLHSENTINCRRFGAESDPNYSIV